MIEEKQFAGVRIYIRGTNLDPDLVSKVLNLKPSTSQTKGGLKPNSQRFIAKIGMWSLASKGKTFPILEQVDDLLSQLEGSTVRLDEIDGVEDACLDIFLPLSDDGKIDKTFEFALTRNQIKRLSKLGLSADFTIS